jgi:MYXO-CTERM domain-containing protein
VPGFIRHSPTPRTLLELSLGLTCLASLLIAPAAGCGPPEAASEGWRRTAIIGGTVTNEYPAVGRFFAGQLGGAGSLCTATLIGKKTVLMAAHCIVIGEPHHFITDDDKAYPAESVVQHHGWDPGGQTYPNDIGLARLSIAPSIKPMLITDRAPAKGQALTIVGFGETSQDKGDAGTKRRTVNTLDTLYSTRFSMSGAGGGEGNICKGDSGGPSFATLGGRFVQIGVHSATQIPCGTNAWDTRVDAYLPWIQQQSGGDIYQPDATPPQVDITAPAEGATVGPDFSLRVSVSDEGGVAKVELRMDGQLASSKTAGPFDFAMTSVPGGPHTFVVTATDQDGNSAQDQLQLSVVIAPKKGFGETCGQNTECESGICASAGATRYCTQTCAAVGGGGCPQGASCLDGGGTLVCGPPVTGTQPPGPSGSELPTLIGSCSVGSATISELALPTLLLLGLLWRRRRRD